MSQVDTLIVKPCMVKTPMTKHAVGRLVADPSETAQGSLRDLGK